MWKPASIEEISKKIYYLPFTLTGEQLAFWNFIRIEPQKWQEMTMGNEGGGFWVVAVAGNKALYFNDIEDGFNLSSFNEYGILNDYNCGQSELHDMIISLCEGIKKEVDFNNGLSS